MAAYGYEVERFESPFDERYLCPICLNVFKDPVTCYHREHAFCRGCITRHILNFQTCPVCKDELTFDTLSVPSRFLTQPLSELKIHCEFVQRGCEEFVQLQYLEKHVEKCGYAPAVCSNEECQREVNRRDLIHHESVECEHRKLKCHHCERLSKDVDTLKQKVTGMECHTAEVVEKLDSLKEQQEIIDDKLTSLKRSNSSIEGNLKKLIKVMESLPKQSRVETDEDDSDSSPSNSVRSASVNVEPRVSSNPSSSTSNWLTNNLSPVTDSDSDSDTARDLFY